MDPFLRISFICFFFQLLVHALLFSVYLRKPSFTHNAAMNNIFPNINDYIIYINNTIPIEHKYYSSPP